jgi:hypothetical protein
MRWFRVYAELIDDPKFIKLAPDLRSGLLMTWCVAAANDGRLPPIEDLAIKFRMPEARAPKLIDDLRRHGQSILNSPEEKAEDDGNVETTK